METIKENISAEEVVDDVVELITGIENLLLRKTSKLEKGEAFIMIASILAVIQDEICEMYGVDAVKNRKEMTYICAEIEKERREGKGQWGIEP